MPAHLTGHIIPAAIAVRYDAEPAVAINVDDSVDAALGVAVGHRQAHDLSPPQIFREQHLSLPMLADSQQVGSCRFGFNQRRPTMFS
ncbi:MAG: hypothetical protein OXG53_18090 [Chloroflexi bacterium]|nr:hypothetical protein [Chloroflexota bacterium]